MQKRVLFIFLNTRLSRALSSQMFSTLFEPTEMHNLTVCFHWASITRVRESEGGNQRMSLNEEQIHFHQRRLKIYTLIFLLCHRKVCIFENIVSVNVVPSLDELLECSFYITFQCGLMCPKTYWLYFFVSAYYKSDRAEFSYEGKRCWSYSSSVFGDKEMVQVLC